MISNQDDVLDIIKGVCTGVMVCVHAVVWLISRGDTTLDQNNFLKSAMPGLMWFGFFLLCIPATAGASYHAFLTKLRDSPSTNRRDLLPTLRIAASLSLGGYAMNALAFGLESTLDWDVLQFVSLSFLLLAAIQRHPKPWLLPLLVVLTPIITPSVRSILERHPNYLTAILVGSHSSGSYWPLFPWFAIIATGFLVERERRRHPAKIPLPLCAGGLVLLGISILVGRPTVEMDPLQIWGAGVFQPPTSVVFATLGFYCVVTAVAIWIRPYLRLPRYGIVRSLSKGVLFIYISHTIVGYRASQVFQAEAPLEVSLVLFPLIILLLSWGVGAVTVFIQSNRIVFTVSKADAPI